MNDPSHTLSSLVAQYAPLASRVSRTFENRPSLRSVARKLLAGALQREHPALLAHPSSLWLTWPAGSVSGQAGSVPLEGLLISRFLQNSTLNLIAGFDTVVSRSGREPEARVPLKVDELEALIDELGPGLLDSYQQSLVGYWNERDLDGSSRWQWLAQYLNRHALQATQALIEAKRLEPEESATLLAVLNGAPLEGTACWLLRIDHLANPLLPGPEATSDLVVTRAVDGAPHAVVLQYSALEKLRSYPDLASLAAERAKAIGRDLTGAKVDFSLTPIVGDPFETQALLLLEHQLTNVTALGQYFQQIDENANTAEEALDRATSFYDLATTDELSRLDQLHGHLPHWLDNATPEDSAQYSVLLSRMADVQRRSAGHSYLEGIETIEAFARTELSRQIREDHPQAVVALEDIEIRLYTVPNAELELINAGDAHLEYVTVSLSALALFNLNGRPAGMLEVEPRAGASLPDWVTKEAVAELVQKVDVGKRYLALLQRLLHDDKEEAQRRERLFVEQLSAQLPLKMFELKVRGEQGVTADGVRMLLEALRPASNERRTRRTIGPKPTVRTLAFVRKAGAPPDSVLAAYVVGPADDVEGIRVLYLPFSREPLRQYSSVHGLWDAITQTGALQNEILAGLEPRARPVYALGGFEEPHIVRFQPGDDFAPITTPEPATLTGVALPGELWHTLFANNVNALLRHADEQSVSNEENIRLGYRELGWLVFNSLLPMLGGPLATAGWMLQSLKAFDDGFERQLAGDPQAANNALVDFLFNTAFLLMAKGMEVKSTGVERIKVRPSENIELPPTDAGDPVASNITVRPGAAPPLQMLDLGWNSARGQLSVAQAAALSRFVVSAPSELSEAVPHGTLAGLYLYEAQWFARVGEDYYAVAVGDGSARVVDLDEPGNLGPWLRRDELGRWQIDTRMHLKGGAPGRARAANRAELERREAALRKTLDDCRSRQALLESKLKVTQTVMADLLQRKSPKYSAYRDRFADATGELVEVSGAALQAAAELNKARVTPRFLEVRATHLQALTILMRSIAEKRIEALAELLTPVVAEGGATFEPLATFEGYSRGSELIDQLISWTGEGQRRMAELGEVEHFGAPRLLEIKPVWKKLGTPVEWAGVQLDWLAILAEQKQRRVPRLDGPLAEAVKSAKLAAQSQDAIAEPGLFTDEEQLQVLDSALHKYDELEDAMDFYRATSDPALESPALERLRERLQSLRADAEAQLLPLLRAQTLRARQRRKQKRPMRNQVVVTTKKRGVVVGRVREADAHGVAEQVEVTGLMASDVEAFERVQGAEHWVAVQRAPAVAPKPLPQAPLESLLREANGLLDGANGKLREGRILAQKVRIPSEIQNLLDTAADQLQAKANEIDRALTRLNEVDQAASTAHQSANATGNELRAKALELWNTGRQLRIEQCKARDPEASRVEWLVAQDEVYIAREGARKPVKGSEDFIQEYAVKDGDNVLWYAHFHYPKLDTPAESYSVAHLKTVAQRFLTYPQFIAQGGTVTGAKALIRAEIQPNMAKKLYLAVGGMQQGENVGG
jgi:hypothetical protein